MVTVILVRSAPATGNRCYSCCFGLPSNWTGSERRRSREEGLRRLVHQAAEGRANGISLGPPPPRTQPGSHDGENTSPNGVDKVVPGVKTRETRSARTGCTCQVTIRHAVGKPHPVLALIKLKHYHEINTAALKTTQRLKAALSPAMVKQVQKMTAAGLKPKVLVQALEAIHGGLVNLRRVQNVRAALTGAERP